MCIELFKEVGDLNLAQQGFANFGDDEIQQIGAALSSDVLFRWLELADVQSAKTIKDSIEMGWRAHPNPTLRLSLDNIVHHFSSIREALDAAQKLVLEDPAYGGAWYLMAVCYLALNETQAALEAANKAVELNPRHYKAMSVQGTIQLSMDQYTLAAQILGDCVKLDPWSPRVAEELSKARYSIHNTEMTHQEFRV